MSILLEVKNLRKYFKTPKGMLHAVDGVNMQIESGKTLGVVGESGCGKSTLGRLVLHLLDSSDGEVYYQGNNITHVNKKELKELRKNMQMIFQDPFSSLNPRKTVSQIIVEPLQIYKAYPSKKDMIKKVYELMDTVGLAKRLEYSYPHELDGGRRQRIGIARALALNPEFIVCDEPVSALDVSIQAQILNLMQDLQLERKLTYMFISHDLSVVKHVSDNICVMYLGTLVESCASKNLFKNPLHPYTKALLSAIPVPKINIEKKRILLKGEISSPINPKPGCRFAPRCLYAKDICTKKQPKLIEVEENHFVACHCLKENNKESM
ncbi:ABC transporter ATP-binding protein [Maledivibacter halophilus]|uniref:Peptide/nickel transport system ATP-binding protein n=1 Tax=Maledivibacter halophilus TaxID=36842 RepID=A0A1T5ICG2_9FIRM|nr:oligopeptide/dipeptide ABC transporter ATP-binding protein [Maledivibacter halophilus]SKC36702.1 peptide/nickel transport system ATP-binding protein [Maledivibacter halophilus]